MAKEFLTLKRQTVVDIANAIRSKTNSDKAIRIEDLDDVIGEIESGGTSDVRLVTGAIPREGHVEKIKFNTNLSKEEVVSILEKLEYYEYDEYSAYYILVEADVYGEGFGRNYFFSAERYYGDGDLLNYAIYGYNFVPNTGDCVFDGYIFATDYENYNDLNNNQWTSCWCPDWEEEYGEINCEVATSYPDWDDPAIIREVGLQNDLLVDLVYAGEELVSKKLTGTYTGVDLEVTENGTVDVLEMIDNKEIPVSVEVNIPTPELKGELKDIIPNEGYIEKIKFNTNLSNEEVVSILEKLKYDYEYYSVFASELDASINYSSIVSLNIQKYTNDEKGICYYIFYTFHDLNMNAKFVPIFETYYGGWITESIFNEYWGGDSNYVMFTDEIEVHYEVVPEIVYEDGWVEKVGLQNNLLIDLMYAEGEPINKELIGTYQPVKLEVTENGAVDILPMIDNKEIPISVEVKVPSPEGIIKITENGEYDVAQYAKTEVEIPDVQLTNAIKAPVPRQGYIETVKFNTNLSKEEVVAILSQLEYDDTNTVYIYYSNDTWIAVGSVDGQYMIANLADMSNMIFDSSNGGWNADFSGEIEVNDIIQPKGYDPNWNEVEYGLQNDLLIDLIYIVEHEVVGDIWEKGAVGYSNPAKEKIYINTSLSKEEVIEMIKDLPYTNTSHSWLVSPCYVAYLTMTTKANRPGMTFLGNSLYIQRPEGQNFEYRICIGNIDTSVGLNYGEEIFNSTDGWINTDSYLNEDDSIKDEFLTGTLPVINNGRVNGWDMNPDWTVNGLNGAYIYTENDKLTDLVYVKKPITISRILQGIYKPVELEITENDIFDVLDMIDNKEMPLSIKVNIPQPPVYDGSVTITDAKDDE